MKLIPTLDRVAIKREDRKKKSKGGILLPNEEESNYGIVVAVGPGGFNQDGTRREMSVKKGDLVFFTDYHVTVASCMTVIVDDEDILAVVKE